MKWIKTFESLVGNKYYFETIDNDLYSYLDKYGVNRIGFYDFNIKLYRVYKDSLDLYRKNKWSWISYTNNFIWKVNKPLNLFVSDEYHLTKLAKEIPSWIPAIKKYFNFTTDSTKNLIDLVETKCDDKNMSFSDKFNIIRFENNEDYFKFIKLWDGIQINDNYFVFEHIIKDSTIVSGNEKTFGINRNIKDDNFPEYVMEELIRYTDTAGTKMKKDVKEWLKENSPKSNQPISLYRGFSLELAQFEIYDEKSLINNPDKLEKYLYRLTGLRKLEDFKKGNYATVKRAKESSWSHTPVIAKQFASSIASSSLNILVKYEARPEDIIIDFTYLPDNIKKQFKYRNQNEVILETGSYKSKIINIWISKYLEKWLNDNGYEWYPREGIIK